MTTATASTTLTGCWGSAAKLAPPSDGSGRDGDRWVVEVGPTCSGQIVRTVLLPLWNVVSFFTTYAEADGITVAELGDAPAPADRPEIDRWVLSVLQSLVADVNREMEGYHLNRVVTLIIGTPFLWAVSH